MPRGIYKRKPRTEEHKRNLSISTKGKRKTKIHALNISKGRTGIKFTEAHKIHISEGKKGIPITEIHRKKISLGKIGKKRKPFTKEHKQNLRLANMNKQDKNTIITHHLYGTKYNETIKTTRSIHRKIHNTAYWYLLEKYGKKEIDNYLKWLFKKLEV